MDILALLGHPVSHSVSPAMHNAAAAELGLNYRYVAQDIAPELLADAITYLRTGKWIGANVTIPYKKAVIPLIDELGDTAKALGAVNTLVRVGKRIRGENTDVEINEAFSTATKSVTSKVLNFVINKKTKYVQEKVDGKTMYSCYVLMAIEPGTVNQSLMDEMKGKNKKTYERFRASQAFEEMDKAMKDYEAQQNFE